MANLMVLIILILIVGAAIAFIIREKKRGVRCVGCPAAGTCANSCSGCSGQGGCSGNCHSNEK